MPAAVLLDLHEISTNYKVELFYEGFFFFFLQKVSGIF